jgi:hypothetical protein
MNRLSLSRRTQVINCLVEGTSIRSTERMTDTHRDTIMRLMVEVGTGCAVLANDQMRDLNCRRIQCDEIWSYVGKKQMHLARGDDRRRLGDQWTFVAIDADTKLVPAYHVGKRTREHAVAFMTDLSERLIASRSPGLAAISFSRLAFASSVRSRASRLSASWICA